MIKEMLDFIGSYRAKSIKSIRGMEGSGWEAQILRDGVMLGQAIDYGDGGSVNMHFSEAEYLMMKEHAIEKNLGDFEPAESFLYYLVNYELEMKKFAKKCQTMILVITQNDKTEKDDNGIPSVITTFKCVDSEVNRKMIQDKYGDVIFINDEIKLYEPPQVKKTPKPKK